MRKERFYTDKRAVKRTAAGDMLALFLALQITGCSQSAGQDKADRTTEQTEESSKAADREQSAGREQSADGGKAAGREQPGQDGQAAAGQGDSVIEYKPGMPIKEGVAAPDFTGELMDGSSITLSELQGKPVIINFWATWCGPCVKEMPAFERLKEDFGDKIGIIAVNCGDDAETVKDFVEENGYTFPVVLDEEYSISMLYPTNSIPYTVVLDAEGKVTHISTGALDADTMYERYKEALGV